MTYSLDLDMRFFLAPLTIRYLLTPDSPLTGQQKRALEAQLYGSVTPERMNMGKN